MNNWIVAPVLMPAMVAAVMAMAMRHDLVLQRVFSVAVTVALIAISGGLFHSSLDGVTQVYRLGDWPAPFGIVLVLDRLSATMLLLTSLLALGVVLYAIGSGWDGRGWHFHALFAFQLMGVNGAFLTGDAFNLFVFFEVLLIASYGLMIHAGGGMRLRSGLQYVVMNLVGSTLFLFAMGTLYAVTGTLNMAHMALRVRAIEPGNEALLLVGATLLVMVFLIKAAAFPVQFWLPGTYRNAPMPVAALFAILTKVGAYAILRMYTLVFGPDAAAVGTFFSGHLLPLALATMVVGALGVLGAKQPPRQASFAVLASMGTLLTAIALQTPQGTTAALFYLVHSTFAAAALFLVVDLILDSQGPTTRAPGGLVAAFFFVAAIASAGMPPLSGFLGKLLLLDASRDAAWMPAIWATVLITSLMLIVGFTLRGSRYMWKPLDPTFANPQNLDPDGEPIPAHPLRPLALTAAAIPLVMLVVLTLAAGPVMRAMSETAQQLYDTDGYIDAVMTPPGEG
ncbi:monovalent cation/H+ antiporter subunit D [Tropicimonas isoalkanivorans]|uniref:Multisubunit potassium/proton antiporter, PhaD subunit n=1 Tax=Tropicimonas isoalkanivorans TaxID=441112 RepID=A0A1I1GI49_9RHOB|nr:monovalent cation/H+ antiporter subunit D [Tropicimonas isoalkanivorans]SFC11105.1 multisubunit potassium/proton antiporter, PhaD subunit [Tropicimonas isoalkanivorans]